MIQRLLAWPAAQQQRAGVDISLIGGLNMFNAAQGSCLVILNGVYAAPTVGAVDMSIYAQVPDSTTSHRCMDSLLWDNLQ